MISTGTYQTQAGQNLRTVAFLVRGFKDHAYLCITGLVLSLWLSWRPYKSTLLAPSVQHQLPTE